MFFRRKPSIRAPERRQTTCKVFSNRKNTSVIRTVGSVQVVAILRRLEFISLRVYSSARRKLFSRINCHLSQSLRLRAAGTIKVHIITLKQQN